MATRPRRRLADLNASFASSSSVSSPELSSTPSPIPVPAKPVPKLAPKPSAKPVPKLVPKPTAKAPPVPRPKGVTEQPLPPELAAARPSIQIRTTQLPGPPNTRTLIRTAANNAQIQLTDEEISQLLNLKLEDGSSLFPPDKLSETDLYYLYEFLGFMARFRADTFFNYYESRKWKSLREVMRELPSLEPARRKVATDLGIFKEKVEVAESYVKCRNCGSRKVTYTTEQTRSGDEGQTWRFTCAACGNKWAMGS